MSDPMLDIIVAHCREPWQVGEKLFRMLALQRGINFEDFRVMLVQDGTDGALPWRQVLSALPYRVKIMTIPHGGVSAARNAGMDSATSDWICFCDFDDTFTDIYALRAVFGSITQPGADMIWCGLLGESFDDSGTFHLDRFPRNEIFIHGKFFRRAFLKESGLRFREDISFAEDTLFCETAAILLRQERVREIPQVLYARCFQEGSLTHNPRNNFRNARDLFRKRRILAETYREHGLQQNFSGMITRTVCDYYFALNYPDYPDPQYFLRDFRDFWQRYGHVFRDTERNNPSLLALMLDASRREAVSKGYLISEHITLRDWLRNVTQEGDETQYDTPAPHGSVHRLSELI